MSNTIVINNLEIFGYHGVHEPEQIQGQRFYINAVLHLDYQQVTDNNDISKTVHYGYVSEDIINYFQNNRMDLIESVAHQLVNMLFEKYQLLTKIELEVVKPWAPLKFSFDDVRVRVEETKEEVYIALGSNLGDSLQNLENAIAAISDLNGVYKVVQSPIYKSKPFGAVAQDDFLNMAIMIETNLHPENLLDALQTIELNLGRTREVHWGPRSIDLDIILYGNKLINTKRLLVPHRYMTKRDFVLKPLLDINEYLVDPRTNQPLIDCYQGLDEIYIEKR